MGTDSGRVTGLRRYLDGTTQSVAVHCQFPSAPEGNRTPDLQLERLASLANGDSGSAASSRTKVRVTADKYGSTHPFEAFESPVCERHLVRDQCVE